MTPTPVPPDLSWQQLIYLLLPMILVYLEKLRRDLNANTQKTESISHSVNGSLDARLKAMADDIKTDIGEAIAENYDQLEKRLDEMDKRLVDLERKAKG
jgi:hypothetical protein